MNEPTTMIAAIGVLAFLLIMRRRRTGGPKTTEERKNERIHREIEQWREGR